MSTSYPPILDIFQQARGSEPKFAKGNQDLINDNNGFGNSYWKFTRQGNDITFTMEPNEVSWATYVIQVKQTRHGVDPHEVFHSMDEGYPLTEWSKYPLFEGGRYYPVGNGWKVVTEYNFSRRVQAFWALKQHKELVILAGG